MTSNNNPKNYGLFPKYLGKIKKAVTSKFGSKENIISFLEVLCKCGDTGLAAEKTLKSLISPLLLYKIINSDSNLSKCVHLAKSYAETTNIATAKQALYEMGINGCPKSLMAYIKIYSPQYQTNIKNVNQIKPVSNMPAITNETDIFEIDPYELEGSNEEEASSKQ